MSKVWILIGLLLLLGSCGQQGRTPPQTPPQTTPPPVQPAAKAPASAPPPKSSQAAPPAPPKGAQYTIFCARIAGDLHVERADRLKKELIASTGMKDWYAIHEAGQSLLYYGYYRSINDPKDSKETARAQADRQRIDQMADSMGNRPFSQALFV